MYIITRYGKEAKAKNKLLLDQTKHRLQCQTKIQAFTQIPQKCKTISSFCRSTAMLLILGHSQLKQKGIYDTIWTVCLCLERQNLSFRQNFRSDFFHKQNMLLVSWKDFFFLDWRSKYMVHCFLVYTVFHYVMWICRSLFYHNTCFDLSIFSFCNV